MTNPAAPAPKVTVRRNLLQAKHCIIEAIDTLEEGHTVDAARDAGQAMELLTVCIARLRAGEVR